MTLSDLIDLEAQLARDRDGDPEALAARDRAALAGRDAGEGSRAALLRAWLGALREREPGLLHPGRSVERALGIVRAALAAGGVLLGWGAATALLRYTGEHPVNVWDVLLAFVGVQLLLLALLLASFLLPAAAARPPLLGLFRGAVAALYPRLARAGGGGRVEEWRALWHRLRSRRSLYHRTEPWLLLGLTQTFGVAFNLGALAGMLRLVVFSDVAFSWSTTLLELDAARFHGLVRALAAPWGWLWPAAVPTAELVEATRYSRLEGAYLAAGAGRAARPELVGGWWPFLAAALATYGLLPRAALLVLARARAARLLAGVPLDDAEVSRVVERLRAPHVETRGLAAASAAPAPRELVTTGLAPRPGARCAVVLWRDVPFRPELEAAVVRQTRCAVAAVRSAAGDEDEDGWMRLADGADPVVVVAEAWEAPDRGTLRLLRGIRRTAGPGRHLVVLLVDADGGGVGAPRESDVAVWRDGLARLEDPYLAVEPLRGSP